MIAIILMWNSKININLSKASVEPTCDHRSEKRLLMKIKSLKFIKYFLSKSKFLKTLTLSASSLGSKTHRAKCLLMSFRDILKFENLSILRVCNNIILWKRSLGSEQMIQNCSILIYWMNRARSNFGSAIVKDLRKRTRFWQLTSLL